PHISALSDPSSFWPSDPYLFFCRVGEAIDQASAAPRLDAFDLVCSFHCEDGDLSLLCTDNILILGNRESCLLELAANAVECSVGSDIQSIQLDVAIELT